MGLICLECDHSALCTGLAAVKSAKCHRTDRVLRRRVYEKYMKIQAVELWMRTINILLRTTRTGNMKGLLTHSLVEGEGGEEDRNRVTYRQNDIRPKTPTDAKIIRTHLWIISSKFCLFSQLVTQKKLF